ncbi:helix-turn-helix domain-containing protein [Aquimarina algicola]|uniref:AraC family transcriptional regulator n=1 Tax=Aquimarina algicola TaxID=2589995 RepID=A0A504J5X9_9FLAO|nr:helix-turn-helix domain-containing protein [Aquimarina algicola]TPN86286.1 AraC family transcriptional regulator [Aquimarina algicola]
MSHDFSDIDILFVIFLSTKFGITILLTTITFTISKKVNKVANRWLTVFILGLSLVFLIDPLREFNDNFTHSLLFFCKEIIVFLIPISLYLAVHSFVKPIKTLTRNDVILCIPWGVDILLKSFSFFSEDVFITENEWYQPWYDIFFIAFCIFTLVKSSLTILKHQKSIRYLSADVYRIDLKWLLYLLLAPTTLIFTEIIFSFSSSYTLIYIADVVEFLLLFYMGYHIVLQKEIFPYEKTQLENIDKVIKHQQQPDTENFALSASKIEEVKSVILQYMIEKQPYLESNITLPKLATGLQMKSHFLSYFLNTHFHKNFYSFINEYRVEESKKILVDPNKKHLNMLGIAFESGFNSKTTFNTTFKKITGVSPSNYRKQQTTN